MGHIEYLTYQFYSYPVVCHEISGEVYAPMSSLTQHVHQLISFAKDSRYLSLYVNKFTIHVRFITRVRCARRLLSCTAGNTMLSCASHAHLMAWVRTLPSLHQIIILIRLTWQILNARVNCIVFFLPVCRVA